MNDAPKIVPRDNPVDVRQRLDTARLRARIQHTAIAQWSPNDRPLKVVKAHIDNINVYLDAVEKEIARCTQPSRKSSKSQKRR
jgi:hypothetical protein